MPAPAPVATRRLMPVIIGGFIVVVCAVAAFFYLRHPSPQRPDSGAATPEVKAYVKNLQLSDVRMQATENFMKQQVIEIQGKIANNGQQTLQQVDVYCYFYGIDGREIHRERVPIVKSTKGNGLMPNQVRNFRLPFDSLPEGWNQAMPRLVIAQIEFQR
jgi:hypothetical protein